MSTCGFSLPSPQPGTKASKAASLLVVTWDEWPCGYHSHCLQLQLEGNVQKSCMNPSLHSRCPLFLLNLNSYTQFEYKCHLPSVTVLTTFIPQPVKIMSTSRNPLSIVPPQLALFLIHPPAPLCTCSHLCSSSPHQAPRCLKNNPWCLHGMPTSQQSFWSSWWNYSLHITL